MIMIHYQIVVLPAGVENAPLLANGTLPLLPLDHLHIFSRSKSVTVISTPLLHTINTNIIEIILGLVMINSELITRQGTLASDAVMLDL